MYLFQILKKKHSSSFFFLLGHNLLATQIVKLYSTKESYRGDTGTHHCISDYLEISCVDLDFMSHVN